MFFSFKNLEYSVRHALKVCDNLFFFVKTLAKSYQILNINVFQVNTLDSACEKHPKALILWCVGWEHVKTTFLWFLCCRRPAQEHQPAPHPLILPLLYPLLSQEQGTVVTTCHCACWFWGGWRPSRCGSGSREPNQCGNIRIRILVKLPSHKKFSFYMKNILKVGNSSKNIPTKAQKPF
jgi:hypothetical protein